MTQHEAPPRPRVTEGWTRRSITQWLGRATVLALTGELLAACSEADDEATVAGAGPCNAELPFEPGSEGLALYADWYERTIGTPDLVDLLVEQTLELSFADILKLPRRDQVTDFHCVEGWSVYDVPWNGIHLSTLLELSTPLPNATHVTYRAWDDLYTDSLPLEVALEPRTLLAYGVGCATLPLRHGFPLRLVVPRKFGYKSAKFLQRISLTDQPLAGSWEKWGYSYDADVQPERLRPGKY
jgi:hypothetical protein